MSSACFDEYLGRGQGFHLEIFGTKREADLASHGVPADRGFDAASSGTKCITPWVTFEMDAQQPLIHGELPFLDYPNHTNLSTYSASDNGH